MVPLSTRPYIVYEYLVFAFVLVAAIDDLLFKITIIDL